MELLDQVSKKFFETLKFYNIDINANKISDINTNVLNGQIMQLKFKKLIHNTEYVLLSSLKKEIIEIQKYNDYKNYMKLDEYLKHIESYNNQKSANISTTFLNTIKNISVSSRESIVNTEEFNYFNEYLHVHRPIEDYLQQALEDLKSNESGIILLVGTVGDGKSHLLSYFNKNKHDLLTDIYIYNDATESDNPYKTAVETLSEKLEAYQSGQLKKLIIAINIGMLNNLKEYLSQQNKNTEIIETIESSNIFSINGMSKTLYKSNDITLVSFLNERNFKVVNGSVVSDFCNGIFDKIFQEDMSNPFYSSFLKDDGRHRSESAYQNYQLMLNEKVRKSVIHLIIKIQIENKRIITTRALLNFIHDIIIPDNNIKENDSFLVNLLFGSNDKSPILSAISEQDPVLIQDSRLDQLNIAIYNSLDLQNKCKELFDSKDFELIKNFLYLLEGLSHKRKFEMIIRLHYLFYYQDYESSIFFEYIDMLEKIEENKALKKDILQKINTAIYKWKGSPMPGFIYNESLKPNMMMRIGLQYDPKPKKVLVTNKLTILVSFEIQGKIFEIEVDYNLFVLMKKIENGYILKEKDKIEAVVFSEFVDNILNNIDSTEKTIINIPSSNETYIINEGFLGYEIERV
ncbi:DNA phosphorothioation-dependent restriction protein DptF [Mammaliicoccus sciuri]|uniref:DNA phosphorothioation-dependent restriction protein DptF n=1 Tax=Mammaliicoccus sciuri TaxID=1296 RepID=UPI000734CE53|nr:DNA phosphorothioation-dependent restriction protein DptF [Mammaliicoccus sciuri]KTT83159.1 DNA-binding protein [Mammaliicoccus sciuri]MBA1397529.1 DNA phosphorothioation-dependent restriction protein DptF [Mammaliicoccus sciuri]MDO0958116.1 DNA phosphorothioation-dependent restriction protein DptF [Mammaliicoccus sciuri]MDT0708335.1 DNA phosphorothioation-dependent restriction protein DptF [Mammaliicoccus sciuri]MDU0267016.1 DNA phosphorothioation-dependent restriction protein DptF [Mammal